MRQLIDVGSSSSSGSSSGVHAKAAPASAWLSLFHTPLHDFDLLIVMRKDALPHLERVVEAAAPGAGHRKGGSKAVASTTALVKHAAAPDALTAVEQGGAEPGDAGAQPPKRCRAILRAFPDQVVAAKGLAKLQQELLIGFDPVKRYLQELRGSYGHLATFCADGHGGRLLGIKWHAAAFLPSPVQQATAHTALVCTLGPAPQPSLAPSAASKGAAKKGAAGVKAASAVAATSVVAGLAVPNIMEVMSGMHELGEGLVEDLCFV